MKKQTIELLCREEIRKANPFFVCNVVALRAHQLFDGNREHSISEAINIALREFVAGDLKFETTNSAASATAVDTRASHQPVVKNVFG